MYRAIIKDINGNEIEGKIDAEGIHQLSAAVHFAGCVQVLVNELNGGQSVINGLLEAGRVKGLSTQQLSMGLLPLFLVFLDDHDFFKRAVRVKTDKNNWVHREISELLHLPFPHKGINIRLVEILQKFDVDGVRSIEIINTASLNQQRLDKINFPDALIPEKYQCALTTEIMTTPMIDARTPEVVYEGKSILARDCNPHNRAPLAEKNLQVSEELKEKIELFVAKAEVIAGSCGEEESDYQKFSLLLAQENVSLDDFEKAMLCLKYDIDSAQDMKSGLEKILRRAAHEGNSEDMKLLVEKNHVDINAQDANMKSRKTALHWVFEKLEKIYQKVHENKTPENNKEFEKYLFCAIYLLKMGAYSDLEDAKKKRVDQDSNFSVVQQMVLEEQQRPR